MSAVGEFGGDAEIRSGAADGPEEVGVRVFGDGDDLARCEGEACAEEIIDGEAVLSRQPTDTAAECKTTDT